MNDAKIFFITLGATSVFFTACSSSSTSNSNASASNSNAAAASSPKPANAPTNANTSVSTAKPFSKTVEMHGIRFLVESPNTASGNTVTIKPSGLSASNEEVKREVKGEVTGADVGDLNIDQSPEVYVYITRSGAEKGTVLIAYATNNKKSMTEASLAPADLSSPDFKGYKGEDEFAVVESSLVRRFPIYDGTGADAKKTGKTRQIQYKLKPGEATWQIVKDKVVEY